MDLDAVGLVAGERGRQPRRTVAVVGEAKFTAAPVGLDQLARLDRAVELIGALGHDAGGARRLLFSRSGFTAELQAAQDQRAEVVLIGLDQLFG